MAYNDVEIRDYYNQAVQKIKTNDKRKHGYVTGVMIDNIKNISGQKKHKIPLAQAARIRIGTDVIRRTSNNFDWTNMFGQVSKP